MVKQSSKVSQVDPLKINLRQLMQGLYLNKNYYASIEQRIIDSDDSQNRIDPDGKSRDLFNPKEKESYISNNHYILYFLDSLSPSKILDIGCGPGWILSELSSDWEKYGVEPNSTMCNYASSFGEITNNNFEKGIFQKNEFDVVLSHHVIEHLDDPIVFIEEIKRILNNDGILILGTPDFDSGCARRFNSNYRLLHDPTHVSLFSNDSMHRFLRDHNFDIIEVEYPYFETEYFNEINLMNLFKINEMSPPFYGNFMTFFCKNNK